MPEAGSTTDISCSAAQRLRQACDEYYGTFQEITRRAQHRFERREWKQVIEDAEERIGLYHDHLSLIEEDIRSILGGRLHDHALWNEIKEAFCAPYLNLYHADLARIFFYSVMRRVFLDTGESVEYSDDGIGSQLGSRLDGEEQKVVRIYRRTIVSPELISKILKDFSFDVPFENLDTQSVLASERINEDLRKMTGGDTIEAIEMLSQPFFRNKAAYLIGRIRKEPLVLPLVIALLNPSTGISLDAVLSNEEDVSNVFTSARSNFHVEASAYREVFEFLRSIAPSRATPYLYSAIGFIHPAKLELVKELRQHLEASGEHFGPAPGVPGTVMITFSLPTFRYVFKVIRDISSKPTFAGPQHVKQQYWRVHRMDRVGRMLDIMTFHNLRFSRDHFVPELLDTLAQGAPSNVDITQGQVVFRHLYAEREVFPLDVFLRDDSFSVPVRSQAAIDYGRAIKDLAATGIFVGDYMPKNFGVTRYGRVVLYDYDDLDDLTRWNFRHLPDPPEWAECQAYDDWLSKGPYDMFPEHDLRLFCVPAGFQKSFLEHHEDILTPDYWNGIKAELLAGNIPEFYPYTLAKRLES